VRQCPAGEGCGLMGRAPRQRPRRLSEKLAHIRSSLGLSQNGMVRRLGLEGRLLREDISRFERGVGGEPPLELLLRYARAISTTGRGEFLEALIDDEIDLPDKLPADPQKASAERKRA
jgi:transcriptional regulator with XRE-family HTH domain